MEIWNRVYKDLSETEEMVSDLEFLECTFQNCEFMDMKLENCNWKECRFEGCVIMNGSSKETKLSGGLRPAPHGFQGGTH